MFKIRMCLIVVVLFDGLNVCNVHGLRAFQQMWALKCENSGYKDYNATVDYQRYIAFNECMRTTFNTTQFGEDFDGIMTNINSTKPEYATIQATLQNYCAPAKATLECDDKLSTECFTEEEKLRWNIHSVMEDGLLDFFCDNDASAMIEFINGNGLECFSVKNISMCYNEFMVNKMVASFENGKEDQVALFYQLPKSEWLCDIIRSAGNCILQSLQLCKISRQPAMLIANLINYIEIKTECNTQPKTNILEIIKASPMLAGIKKYSFT